MDEAATGARAVIVMGVAGAGKSSVGRALAAHLGWSFFDADDFHSPANRAKMSRGQALNDGDRRPWLDCLHRLLAAELSAGRPLVLACSALKRSHRQRLIGGLDGVYLVYLRGDRALLEGRLAARPGHFFPPALLTSQLRSLEEPETAIRVAIDQPIGEIVQAITAELARPANETRDTG